LKKVIRKWQDNTSGRHYSIKLCEKYYSIKHRNKNREENVSRLTATCDLLTEYCDFSRSIKIKI
jgi:hypothetical protein